MVGAVLAEPGGLLGGLSDGLPDGLSDGLSDGLVGSVAGVVAVLVDAGGSGSPEVVSPPQAPRAARQSTAQTRALAAAGMRIGGSSLSGGAAPA